MKAKKNSTHSKSKNHEKNLTAITALLILGIGFAVFFIFNNYLEDLLDTSSLQSFVILAIMLSAFLFGLLYLLNPKR